MRGTARAVARTLALALLVAGPGGRAADLDGPAYGAGPGGSPRYFPRGDGSERPVPSGARLVPVPFPVGCAPRRVPVPTNAPDDPSYVGSSYGLGHPSYYGFTPPLGVDDPFGRSLRPYCP